MTNKVSLAIRILALVIFVQLALGGLLTFDFISPTPHIITGFLVLALAVLVVIVLYSQGRAYEGLKRMSVAMLGLILIQIAIGFATLETGNKILAWIHLLVALGIYGMIVSETFIATIIGRGTRKENSESTAIIEK